MLRFINRASLFQTKASILSSKNFCTTPSQPEKFKVLFFGTDIIAKTVLEALHKNLTHQFKKPVVEKLAVVTSPDITGKKKQQPVKIFCEEKRIEHYQPLSKVNENHLTEWNTFLEQNLFNPESGEKNFDIGIACSFGYMIPDPIIDYFSQGMVVIHPSLLPKYRGASPIQYSLLNGDKETGISIIEISKGKFDAGKVFIQEKIAIEPTMRYSELAMELAVIGGNRILDLLDNYGYYKTHGILQSETGYKRSSAKKFEQDDAIIHWKDCSNEQVYNRYRALYSTGLHTIRTKFNETWFFIDELGIVKENEEEDNLLKAYTNAVPGSIWLLKHKKYKNFLYVKCKEGWVVIRGGYLESTKPQPSYRFIEKHINKDTILGDASSNGHYIFQ